ncbi:ankyrin repeat-containing domain protein [Lactarius pseudohatsudake]|nr:ankyrin repeat-containing domain protein [Lactarius pseudohatsudake]
MAYFYFDFRDADKQNRRSLLLSLLSQLSARSDLCCDILHRAYLTHDNGVHKPTDDVLIQCLKETLMFSNDCPIYIIMDALDECPDTFGLPSPRNVVLDLVKDLVELSLPNLHICVTSRPEIDIQTALEPLTSLRVSLHDQTGQREDIVEYVSSVVHSDTRMGKWRDEDQNLVIETLSDRADGMFRWVFCQLEVLRQCFPPSLRRILRELPESLDETYERILKSISKATRDHAHRLLQCLTVAVRPLRLEELAQVLAFDFDEASGGIPKLNGDWRREDQEQAVLSTCSSLITVVHDGQSRVVQFSHFSVKEFLTSDRLAAAVGDTSFHHIVLELAHTILAQACLGVLLRLDDGSRKTSVHRFPLVEYAARHWVDHALFEKPHFSRWVRIHDMDDDNPWGLADGETPPERLEAAPMYYAALCGFPDVVEKLIREHPEHISARGGGCGTALHAASRSNYVNVGQSLLKHGADVNSQGQWERTPLHVASIWKHLEIDDHWTPLHMAARNGNFELVRMLLTHNADINARNDIGHTPLHAASNNGHVDIARFLLDHGADPKARGEDRSTPLHWASYWGELEVAHLLLERGADVDAEDGKGRTAY